MGFSKRVLASFLLVAATNLLLAYGQPLVPAFNIFGDSVVDSGNNNNLYTLVKANFPPYEETLSIIDLLEGSVMEN